MKNSTTMMSDRDIEASKLDILMRAVIEEGQTDETLDELKAVAFEVLLLHPGCEHNDWVNLLVEQYGMELTDAYGTDPAEVYSSLDELWESPYLDKASGLEYAYKTWAEAFATDASVQMYYDMINNN